MILFVALAVVGAFFAANYLAAPDVPGDMTAEEILSLAKKQVPPPVLPPKPAGREVVTTEQRQVQIQVPRVETQWIKVGPLKTKIPSKKVVTETQTVTQDVPVRRLEGASPAEIANWERETARIQREYDAAVRTEVQKIEQSQKATVAAFLKEAQPFIKDSLIPLITSLTGLIGALATWRWGHKPARQQKQ